MIKKFLLINIIIISISLVIGIKIINNNKIYNIEDTKNSIVTIIPEQKLISYRQNPKGIITDYKNSGIGAGFFVSNDGLIQTVKHLVEDDSINYKVIYNNKEYESEIISRDSKNDLAILRIEIQNIKPLSGIFSPYQDKETIIIDNKDEVISFGIDIENLEIVYNTGIIINKKSRLGEFSNLLEISNTLSPGFSGGPIINSDGKVVGINYAVSEGKSYGIYGGTSEKLTFRKK